MSMQTKRELLDYGMMLLPSLEEFVPKDHYLRRLDGVLDLGFVHEAVRDRYCQDNGRPSVDPEVVLRLFLLQAVEGIASVRRLMQRVHVDLSYRWFIGYRVDEKLPDHSTLSKALDRFGDEVFNELFERSVRQCQDSGLIEGKILHVDATTIRADLDVNRVDKSDSPDKDARFGRFPDGRKLPGYKQQTVVDSRSRVVVGVSVAPANHAEGSNAVSVVGEAVRRMGVQPDVVCADSAYASGGNRAAFEERGIRLVSPPRLPRNHTGTQYFTIEEFTYDATRDLFVCPAGQVLHQVGSFAGRCERRKYRASIKACRDCVLKPQCTRAVQRCLNVSIHHAALVRLRADSKTESFKQLYRARAPVVEGVFAEAKQWHGLRRAWRRGLAKMSVQCLLIAAVMNFKRLGALYGGFQFLRALYNVIVGTIWRVLSTLGCQSTRMMPVSNAIV